MKHRKKILIGMLLFTIFLVNMTSPASAIRTVEISGTRIMPTYCLDSSIPSGWLTPLAQSANAWNNAGANFYFYSMSCNNKLSYAPIAGNVAGRTTHDFSGSTIIECDTVFNSNYDWSTADDCPSDCLDVRNVATHEFGHWLRLLDVDGILDAQKTMYYKTNLGETNKQSLHSDDITGIQAIYS